MIFYAGASLPQDVWDGLEALATAERGRRAADELVLGPDRDRAGRR